jgi:pimeloyl-ACP methyl ester carboxylesterase/DNA-binding SARP family transcriptional activator
MATTTPELVAEQGLAPIVEIRVLGGLSVTRGGAEAPLPPSRKTRALVAYLAVAERPQRRERLCEVFWDIPDDPRAALRWSLSRLRHAVGDALETSRDTVALRREAIVLDYDRLRKALSGDPATLDSGELEAVAGLFRGPFLDDLSLPRCPDFEAWRIAHANEAEIGQLRILRALVDRLADDPARALTHARSLELLNPGDSALAAEVKELSARSRQDALAQTAAPATSADASAEKPRPPPIAQEIRYCRAADGTQLAYAITGEGYPLLKCANWMSDLQYDWDSSVWRHWIASLSEHNRLIRYDQRGNGLSDRNAEDLSFDAQLNDLEAVADAARLDRFALLGISAGAALSIAYAVRHPQRVSHLILYGGRPRGWKHSGTPLDQARRAAMVTLIRAGWGQDNPAFRQMFTSLFIPDATLEQMDWYNELQRRTVSPENAARLHEASGDTQVTHLLEQVATPTLVLHSEGDALVPFDLGRELAIGIPDARFVALDSRNHILLADEPALQRFLDELRRFVG